MTDTYNKAEDYLKQYSKTTKKLESIKAKVAERFLELCTRFPEAPIATGDENTIIKAKGLADKDYIKRLSFDDQIMYIRAIEEWIENIYYTQGNLFINKK